MPPRVVFTNPITGRIISAIEAAELGQSIRSVYDGGLIERQILEFGRVAEDLTQDAEPNWTQRETTRGYVWETEEGNLSLSALGGADFPENATHFRLVYDVGDDSQYKGGFASTEWLPLGMFAMDLSLLEGVAPQGIARVFFEKGE